MRNSQDSAPLEEEPRGSRAVEYAGGLVGAQLPAELTEAQVRECGERGLRAVALPMTLSPLAVQAYAEKVAASAVRAALALRTANVKP